MQKMNWSVIIGGLLIGIAIIIAGQGIVTAINNRPVGGYPNSLDINSRGETAYGDFLYETEAAEYLKISYDTLYEWINSGKLHGTYTGIEQTAHDEYGQPVKAGTQYVFSKAKLTAFMNGLMDTE